MDTICNPAGTQWLVSGSGSKILHWGAQNGPIALGCICSSSVQTSSVQASWAWSTSWILSSNCFFINREGLRQTSSALRCARCCFIKYAEKLSLEASAYQDCQWCSGLCQVWAPKAEHQWEIDKLLDNSESDQKLSDLDNVPDLIEDMKSKILLLEQALESQELTMLRLRKDAKNMEEEQGELRALHAELQLSVKRSQSYWSRSCLRILWIRKLWESSWKLIKWVN